jgi:hypothetical protein
LGREKPGVLVSATARIHFYFSLQVVFEFGAHRLRAQLWPAAGLVVGGARTVLFMDGSHHPIEVEHDSFFPPWRFHAGGDPVDSMCAGHAGAAICLGTRNDAIPVSQKTSALLLENTNIH